MTEEEEEKSEVDSYFEANSEEEAVKKTLKEVLQEYVQTAELTTKSLDKSKNSKVLLFKQTVNGTLYRGFIKLVYFDASRLYNLGKCLYITHVIVSPRKGNFLDPTLKEILQENTNKLDSIYIESIMSERVVEYFEENGWSVVGGNNVFLKKAATGGRRKKKKNKTKKNKTKKNKTKKRSKKYTKK